MKPAALRFLSAVSTSWHTSSAGQNLQGNHDEGYCASDGCGGLEVLDETATVELKYHTDAEAKERHDFVGSEHQTDCTRDDDEHWPPGLKECNIFNYIGGPKEGDDAKHQKKSAPE